MLSRKGGFTLVELLIVLAIIAILAAIIIPAIDGGAHGGQLQLQTYMEPTDANIRDVARAIASDPDQTVTVLSYAAKWDVETADASISLNREIQAKLRKAGVSRYKIVFGMANQAGLEFDGFGVVEAIDAPDKDGVYLYLN